MNELLKAFQFWAFWVFLFVGTISTTARVAYYRAHGYKRPRLLVRDLVYMGGFALSFGLVLFARAANAAGYDTSSLSDNIWWTVLTGTPALIAVATYAYFEVFVIERGTVLDQRMEPPAEDDA